MDSKPVCWVFFLPTALVLYGCGGGGGDSGGASSTSSTPSPHWQPDPLDPETLARKLNFNYGEFGRDQAYLGVTISFAFNTSSFDSNLLCSPLMGTSCYMGQADCRMSASIFNHKVIVPGNHVVPTMNRPVGFVINQREVEDDFGKCAYMWKGDSSMNLNNGCGPLAASKTCGDPNSAFANQCGKGTCDDLAVQVRGEQCFCMIPLVCEESCCLQPPVLPADGPCLYAMWDLNQRISESANRSSWGRYLGLLSMLNQRIAYQAGSETLAAEWNEIVIDERPLIERLRIVPTEVIWGFVCVPSADPDACKLATQLRDDFQTTYGVRGTIPVLAFNLLSNFTAGGGPFSLPDSQIIV